MYFDEKLQKLRKERGLSLEGLSRELGIPESMLERLETGFRDPLEQELTKITNFFQVTPEDLADDQPAANAFSVLFGAGCALSFAPEASPDPQELLPDLRQGTLLASMINHSGQAAVYEYPEEYIRAIKAPEGEYASFTVHDDSLRALGIFKNDTAIVRRQSEIEAGQLAAVSSKEQGGVLLRLATKSGRDAVCETAADDCVPLPLSQDEQIYGRVVEIRRNL